MSILEDLRALVAEDQIAVDQLIINELYSSVPLVEEIGQYIINSGGKRLRPLVVLLMAHACAYRGADHIALAVIIEFIHTATLLHDDVVDGSLLRRHQDTANAIWGGSASVLVGDFIYSRAFQLIAKLNQAQITRILAEATNRIAEGEVLQLINRHQVDLTEQAYFDVIDRKTATLFAAATELAAVLANQSAEIVYATRTYGYHLGLAFQLIDDVLDYSEDNGQLGKNIGDDLAEGKMTLPLIYALAHSNTKQVQAIQTAIANGDKNALPIIQETIVTTDAIAYTYAAARRHAQEATAALAQLAPVAHREALIKLAEFVITRQF